MQKRIIAVMFLVCVGVGIGQVKSQTPSLKTRTVTLAGKVLIFINKYPCEIMYKESNRVPYDSCLRSRRDIYDSSGINRSVLMLLDDINAKGINYGSIRGRSKSGDIPDVYVGLLELSTRVP